MHKDYILLSKPINLNSTPADQYSSNKLKPDLIVPPLTDVKRKLIPKTPQNTKTISSSSLLTPLSKKSKRKTIPSHGTS